MDVHFTALNLNQSSQLPTNLTSQLNLDDGSDSKFTKAFDKDHQFSSIFEQQVAQSEMLQKFSCYNQPANLTEQPSESTEQQPDQPRLEVEQDNHSQEYALPGMNHIVVQSGTTYSPDMQDLVAEQPIQRTPMSNKLTTEILWQTQYRSPSKSDTETLAQHGQLASNPTTNDRLVLPQKSPGVALFPRNTTPSSLVESVQAEDETESKIQNNTELQAGHLLTANSIEGKIGSLSQQDLSSRSTPQTGFYSSSLLSASVTDNVSRPDLTQNNSGHLPNSSEKAESYATQTQLDLDAIDSTVNSPDAVVVHSPIAKSGQTNLMIDSKLEPKTVLSREMLAISLPSDDAEVVHSPIAKSDQPNLMIDSKLEPKSVLSRETLAISLPSVEQEDINNEAATVHHHIAKNAENQVSLNSLTNLDLASGLKGKGTAFQIATNGRIASLAQNQQISAINSLLPGEALSPSYLEPVANNSFLTQKITEIPSINQPLSSDQSSQVGVIEQDTAMLNTVMKVDDNSQVLTAPVVQSGISNPNNEASLLRNSTVTVPISDRQWAQEFASQVTLHVQDGAQSARIHLNPRELGPIDIYLNLQGDQATVRFHSGQESVREVINHSLPLLKEMLAQSGFANVDAQTSQGGNGNAASYSKQYKNEFLAEDKLTIESDSKQSKVTPKITWKGEGRLDAYV